MLVFKVNSFFFEHLQGNVNIVHFLKTANGRHPKFV